MNLLSALPVRTKLPMIVVGLCLAAVAMLVLLDSLAFREESRRLTEVQFEGIAQSRQLALTRLLADTEVNLQMLAESPEVANAVGALGASYRLMPEATRLLQQAYIDDNPNPAGQRQDLNRAGGDAAYHIQHAAFHTLFRKIKEKRRLYDVFLFDSDLNSVYTVFKEPDFAASFRSGPLARSGLGVALKKAEAAAPGEVIFGDFSPYAPSNGLHAAFMVTKIASRSGVTMGYMAFQVNSAEVSTILDDRSGLGETGRVYLVGLSEGGDRNVDFVLGSDVPSRVSAEVAGTMGALDAGRTWPQIEALAAGEAGFFQDVPVANGQPGFATTTFVDYGGMRWGLVVERESSDVYQGVSAMVLQTVLIGLAIAAVATFVGILFARSITRPLSRISAAVDSIANGDLQVEVIDADRRDELGLIATSLRALLDKLTVARRAEEERERLQTELRQVVERLSAGLQDLAEGNLSRPIREGFAAGYDSLRHDFNTTLQNLATTITQVVDASQNIRARSTEISAASVDLSHRTENQAAALEQTTAALDQLTASVRSAADGAREVEDIVRAARKGAEDSGVVVQGAVAAMAEIERSSEQISQIIGAIDDIAFQTNLLALNAGVEAARAGDAGKGFAVVASEVRALAQRSSAAAKEIKTLIATSAQHVGRGVDQVGKAGEALNSIVGSVSNISSLISTIALGASEQSTGLAEINIGVTQLDQVTQQNAAMVEESTAASHSLHQDATGLAELVSRFTIPPRDDDDSRPITLSQFMPTGFIPPATMDGAEPPAQPIRPARAASATTQAMWQEF